MAPRAGTTQQPDSDKEPGCPDCARAHLTLLQDKLLDLHHWSGYQNLVIATAEPDLPFRARWYHPASQSLISARLDKPPPQLALFRRYQIILE
ncbi:MAG: hypothetical protein KDK39_07380 [Leptospiraceae bacterium]|nr:hypothetical protein [Leptospiraceae bacterium]